MIREANKVRIVERVSYCVILQNKGSGYRASAIESAGASEIESSRVCSFRLQEEY
jgi:hypothetical protein